MTTNNNSPEEGFSVRHAEHPTVSGMFLCYGNPSNSGNTFAGIGVSVNCPNCRVVINFCKEFERYTVPVGDL